MDGGLGGDEFSYGRLERRNGRGEHDPQNGSLAA